MSTHTSRPRRYIDTRQFLRIPPWLFSLVLLGLLGAAFGSWLAWLGGVPVPLAVLTSGTCSFSATVTLGYAVRAMLRS